MTTQMQSRDQFDFSQNLTDYISSAQYLPQTPVKVAHLVQVRDEN
jgi:hypothetical protein